MALENTNFLMGQGLKVVIIWCNPLNKGKSDWTYKILEQLQCKKVLFQVQSIWFSWQLCVSEQFPNSEAVTTRPLLWGSLSPKNPTEKAWHQRAYVFLKTNMNKASKPLKNFWKYPSDFILSWNNFLVPVKPASKRKVDSRSNNCVKLCSQAEKLLNRLVRNS